MGRALGRNRGWRLVLLFALLAAAFLVWHQQRRTPTRSYRVAEVDPRFGLELREVEAAAREAVALWEKAAGRFLFRLEPRGEIAIRLVYDHRQEAVDRLRALGLRMDGAKASYDEARARFEALKADLDGKQAAFRAEREAHGADVERFNSEVRGFGAAGVSAEARPRLEATRQALALQDTALRRRREELETLGRDLEGLALVVNELAAGLNLDVDRARTLGEGLGQEFCQGQYVRENGQQRIAVYHVLDRDGLVRVLAHELGHALGLEHVDAPGAIMHRLAGAGAPRLAPADVAALRAVLR